MANDFIFQRRFSRSVIYKKKMNGTKNEKANSQTNKNLQLLTNG